MATSTPVNTTHIADIKFPNSGAFRLKMPAPIFSPRDTFLPNQSKHQTKFALPSMQNSLYSSILQQWLMRSVFEGIQSPGRNLISPFPCTTNCEKPNYLLQDLNARYKELLITRLSGSPGCLNFESPTPLISPFFPNPTNIMPSYSQFSGTSFQSQTHNPAPVLVHGAFKNNDRPRNITETCNSKSREDNTQDLNDLQRNKLDLVNNNIGKERKSHKCIYCGKLYSRKYGLKIHIRTHTGYKPLKCKVCGRPFGDPSNLNKHVRLHAEGDTPYRCKFCGKVLVRRRDLDRHIKSRHSLCGNTEKGLYTDNWKI
ncbi:uncharacterized protein LOC120338175 [Styela clava]